ncbi:hypothetical protein AAFF_G00333400, partial [Aldrovandia affinis]
LKEQLLARSARVEDIERLKEEFSRQRRDIQEHNEAELENLRMYFEQRLRSTEENYREEVAMLQLRLVEGALEDSALKTGDSSFLSEGGQAEEEKCDILAEITLKLEQHKEEVAALRIEDLKTRHALELEQQRAKLSDSHLKALVRLRGLSTCDVTLTDEEEEEEEEGQRELQVESPVKERALELDRVREQNSHMLTRAQEEVEERARATLEQSQDRASPQGGPQSTQDSPQATQSPHSGAGRHELQAQCENELNAARSAGGRPEEQTEAELQEAHSRFLEEQRRQEATIGELRQQHRAELEALEAELHAKHRAELEALEAELHAKHRAELEALEAELHAKHRAELEALEAELHAMHRVEVEALEAELEALEAELHAKHRAELEALEAELHAKHRAELEALETVLQEANLAQLEAQEAELQARHRQEREELEARMLLNMDTLESSYLAEIEAVRGEGEQALRDLREASERARQEAEKRHAAELLSSAEQLKRGLAQLQMGTFTAMAAELKEAHQVELTAALVSQCEALKMEQRRALQAADEEHSATMQELRELHSSEIQRAQEQLASLREQHEQQLQEQREGLSRQRLHLEQEEQQLLQRVAHLKEEFAVEKAATLEEWAHKAQVWGDTVDQLSKQLQEQQAQSSQLRAEASSLQGALQGKRSEMETLQTLLQRRERENQEGENLLTMLRTDLGTAAQQRAGLQKVLLEVLWSTITTEDAIRERDTQEKGEGGEDRRDSALMDEGLDLSQRLSESLFAGAELDPEGEAVVLGACVRLRSAVDKLLELLTESTRQLEHVHLEEHLGEVKTDTEQLVLQHRLLLEQLDTEAGLKSQLELELHKAEGLMDGYVAEKAALEEALQQKETQAERLVEELEGLRGELQELGEERTLLLRQMDCIAGRLGDPEKELLQEAARLAQEKLDVQRQAHKDRSGLAARLKLLEGELEEQEGCRQEQEEKQRAHTEDLQQHLQALERQLKHHRQFMDEQAVEREHERDEFQQEIKKLEAQLKQPNKPCSGGDGRVEKIEDLVLQVESLQAAMKQKMEDYSALLLAKEQLQQDSAEQNEEIDKMAGRIRELEQALLSSSEANRALAQLEQELQKARRTEQELLQDKEALQQQQFAHRLQISALQSKLDESRHVFPESSAEHTLKEQLQAVRQTLLYKEKEVGVLLEQLEQVQRDVAIKAQEVLQLHMRLTHLTEHNSTCVSQLQGEISSLKETVSSLRRQEADRDHPSCTLPLPLALLNEKNQEIDHLNEQILRLQQEVDVSKDNKAAEEKRAELEELRSQVEHLRSDHARLRQDKEHEVEQLHEVISKLQEELAQLGPNRHEVSDPQDHSPEPHPFWPPQEESLGQELSRQGLQSSHARLAELRGQLALAASDNQALQSLLHTQERTFRGQLETLGRSLAEERQREEKALLKQQVGELEQRHSESCAALHAHRATLAELKADIHNLHTAKRQALSQREGRLQEEIERLKQEVTSNRSHIQDLNSQLVEKVAEHAETHKEVLMCAEETLAKAEQALREREEQLAGLRVEHEALRVELAAVKEGLSSSTERAEKLLEEGQTKDRALAELEVYNQRLKAELRGLQEDLALQEEEVAYQQRELDDLRDRYAIQGPAYSSAHSAAKAARDDFSWPLS